MFPRQQVCKFSGIVVHYMCECRHFIETILKTYENAARSNLKHFCSPPSFCSDSSVAPRSPLFMQMSVEMTNAHEWWCLWLCDVFALHLPEITSHSISGCQFDVLILRLLDADVFCFGADLKDESAVFLTVNKPYEKTKTNYVLVQLLIFYSFVSAALPHADWFQVEMKSHKYII